MSRLRLHAPEAQPVTFVELFFDLVFVFAVTQVTVLTAHHLDVGGVLRSLLLFWLVWWAWTQFTWTLSPADTDHVIVRVCTLAATAAAFVMAASVPLAFGDEALWFAAPYVFIRAVGLSIQVVVDRERAGEQLGLSMRWVYISAVGLVAVLAGSLVETPARYWVWGLAILCDVVAAAIGGRDAVWDLDTRHFSERHGLFVIIALGESLIVAGTAVAEDERTSALVLTAGASLTIACLLWWTYFGWLKAALEHRFSAAPPERVGSLARDAFSLGHFPLICGIIGFAVAVEEILLHPDEPATTAVIVSLGAGIALFVSASALACWRITGRVLAARLVIVVVVVLGLVVLADEDPVWPLSAVAVGLLAIVLIEGIRGWQTGDEPSTANGTLH